MEKPWQILGIDEGSDDAAIRRAHRELAKRWHPDRFPDGPERMWAEQKMVKINAAYNELIAQACPPSAEAPAGDEAVLYHDVRQLIEMGQLTAARQALMRAARRSAEWNYLFGAVLFEMGDCAKAAIYLRVAVRQAPENLAYRSVCQKAESACSPKHNLLKRIKGALTAGINRIMP